MKKQKWVRVEKTNGEIVEIDYGWQSEQWCGNVVFKRIKDGKEIKIPIPEIKSVVYNTK